MITAGQLRFTALGRVRVIQANPIDRGLTPTILGVLCYTEEPPSPADYNDELGYALNGSICAQLLPAQRDAPVNKGLRIATTEPISHYWMGLPITTDGRLAVFAGRTMAEHDAEP